MHNQYNNTFFTTLAIDGFINIFKDYPETNFIILDSFNNLTERKLAKIYAFVIMQNHIHIVWQISEKNHIEDLINSFKKYTGRLLSNYLKEINEDYLNHFHSVRQDRKIKIWKITKGNIIIHNLDMLGIKIRYIHNNPSQGSFKTVNDCTDFYFSSANAYATQATNFKFLTVLEENILWC